MQLVPPINLFGNLVGAAVMFVWFAGVAPGVRSGTAQVFWERMGIFSALVIVVLAVVIPINLVWIVRPLLRQLKRLKLNSRDGILRPSAKMDLRLLVGRILDLPLKLSATTMAAWIGCALILDLLPRLIPHHYPWPPYVTHRIVAWVIIVGAPTTVLVVYFVMEWWLRRTAAEVFPHEALTELPASFRINVLPKLLVVTLLVGILPVALMSHVVLYSINDIQAGRESIGNFFQQMPGAVWFLLIWTIGLSVGLSVFMSKSVSEPLRYARSALDKLAKGNPEAIVPVVSNDDIGQMADQLNRMVRESRELDSIRDTFGRYLSAEVVEEILKSPAGVELGGELRTMTIMVADLRGFTSLSESLHPRVVLELLNRYLERMTDIIIAHEGTIDEFTGDGILVFFGAPRRLENHAKRAVVCALEMQESMHTLNRENLILKLPTLHMGIGVNSGELIVGNIGSEKRKKYGAVGSPINLAFRAEAHSAGGEVLLTPFVLERLNGEAEVESTREVQVKGLEKPLLLHRVVGLRDA